MTVGEPDDRIRRTLREFLEFAEAGGRLVDRGRQSYDDDEMLRLAAESIMHKIGEAIARLPDDFMMEHPSVSWRPMKGMRNKVAHEYEVVDYAIIWNALELRLPKDAAEVSRILDGLG